jgi:hypothetical protein
MDTNSLDIIYKKIFSDKELQKVYSMREENNSESFDEKKAIETARKSNFSEAVNDPYPKSPRLPADKQQIKSCL